MGTNSKRFEDVPETSGGNVNMNEQSESGATPDGPHADPGLMMNGPTPALEIEGVFTAIGELRDDTVIQEQGLAALFKKCPKSIRRAVKRGELPPPVRVMGKPMWTVGHIRKHIQGRLDHAAHEAAQLAKRLASQAPQARR